MARGQEATPFYIRTDDGETFYVDTLEEALEEFVKENGYRLTLCVGENEIVIRRNEWLPHDGSSEMEILPGRLANASVTWRKK